ncbi:MAG: hypothetical protein N3G20_02315, partial [Verrucomicrobiae bacterium]|nr:hypothetical protein [Verrucomicrobiae bacterium]
AIGAKVLVLTTGGADKATLLEHNPDWLGPDLSNIDAELVCGRSTPPGLDCCPTNRTTTSRCDAL